MRRVISRVLNTIGKPAKLPATLLVHEVLALARPKERYIKAGTVPDLASSSLRTEAQFHAVVVEHIHCAQQHVDEAQTENTRGL